jgi:DNA end-binding protein Ku
MPPRSIWNGAIAFGAVNVPIKVFGAREDRGIHFHEVHLTDGGGIEHRLVDPTTGKEVPRDKVVKGYEVEEDTWVVVSNDELKAADQPQRKAVELEDFVPADQIDPIYYDKAYNLAPQKGAEDAYALLVAALEKTGRAGVGRVVLRTREQVVAVRPAGKGALRMHTMHAADEIVSGDELEVPEPKKKPAKREIDMAAALVDQLAAEFDPKRYKDTYRERVLRLIEQKAKGKEIKLEKPEPPAPSDDLMAALQASVDAVKGNGKKKR